jgi:3-deoxy-D-manno-octulosonic-acid transferase
MIWLYRILFLPLFVLLCPYFLWRTRRRKRDWAHWAEHFGFYPPMATGDGRKRIWIHGVSVGELQSIAPLVELLRREKNIFLIISTTSTTGRQIAEKSYSACAQIVYFPIDFWPFVRNAWKRIRPDLVISVDSELWPEHLHRARKVDVPVGIVNGRLSGRSFRRYCRIPALARWLWEHISFVFACDDDSANRIGKFISHPAKIIAVGNLKCSRQPSLPLKKSERTALLHSIGLPDFGSNKKPTRILFGCSTWPGEEELLLETFAQLRESDANWRLILVPRHAERRGEIVELCTRDKFSFHLRSTGEPRALCHDVAIIDSTGELSEFIRLGTIAFLGKTLPPNAGAQSPLDAVAAKIPLVCGPNYGNFHEIVESLRAAKAMEVCPSADAVKSTLLNLARDEVRQGEMAARMLRYLLETKNMARTIHGYVEDMFRPR